ncbi:response regulator [Burkholderiaceae bacterium DAT-1]|nr:response regulator [Burkholderiaceae bacterium DAT-1]
MTLPVILIVDDDPMVSLLLRNELSDQYTVLEADSGETALAVLDREPVNLVILDIVLPGMSGYDACRTIRQSGQDVTLPVIFLSGELALEDRLRAYEAGGDDFVTKPPVAEELKAKLQSLLKVHAERSQLAEQARSAFDVAMTAMTSASETGIVMAGLRQCLCAPHVVALANALISTCGEYGLDACVRVVLADRVLYQNAQGAATPVEAGILDRLAQGDRIFSFGKQAAFNYDGLTLLIRNMPVDDEGKMGRLRDHLAILAEAGQERRQRLVADAVNRELMSRHRALYDEAVRVLKEISEQQEHTRRETAVMLDVLISDVEVALAGLGLSVRQEDLVSRLLGGTAYRIGELLTQSLQMQQHLETLQARIQEG